MLVFFTSGLFANVIVRLIVARVCAYVIASHILKPNQVVLIGVENELGSSSGSVGLDPAAIAVVGQFAMPSVQIK